MMDVDMEQQQQQQQQCHHQPHLRHRNNKRTICDRCYRPTPTTCICTSLPSKKIILHRTEIIVIQHPLEIKHHKKMSNRSIPILQLCLHNSSLHLCTGRRLGYETLLQRDDDGDDDDLWDKLHHRKDLYQPVLVFPRSNNNNNNNGIDYYEHEKTDGTDADADRGDDDDDDDDDPYAGGVKAIQTVLTLTQLVSKLREDDGRSSMVEQNTSEIDGEKTIDQTNDDDHHHDRNSVRPTSDGDHNTVHTTTSNKHKIVLLIVLDATWKHAREMHSSNLRHRQYPSHMWQVSLEPTDWLIGTAPTRVKHDIQNDNKDNVVVDDDGAHGTSDESGLRTIIDSSTSTTQDYQTFRPRRFEIRTTPSSSTTKKRSWQTPSSSFSLSNVDNTKTTSSVANTTDTTTTTTTCDDTTTTLMSTAECVAWIVSRLEALHVSTTTTTTTKKTSVGNNNGTDYRYTYNYFDGPMKDIVDKGLVITEQCTDVNDNNTNNNNDGEDDMIISKNIDDNNDDNTSSIHDHNNVVYDQDDNDDELRLYHILMRPLDAMVEQYKSFVSTPKVRRQQNVQQIRQNQQQQQR